MLEKIKGVCGNIHIVVLAANLAVTALAVGIAWGTLNAEVNSLERDVEKLSALQAAWNTEEHKTDENHRDRINQIEDQIFQVITHMSATWSR